MCFKNLTMKCRTSVFRYKNVKRLDIWHKRYFCEEAWFRKEQHKRWHNHMNKWTTSKSGDHLTDPLSKKIFHSKSAKQIISILDSSPFKEIHLHSVALRKLIDLQEFDSCWRLFKDIQTEQPQLLSLPIYNTMIYLCVQVRTKYALKQALELYNQMTVEYELKPDLITFTNLISLCTATAAWDKAENFWKILINSREIPIDLSAYNTMISCYVKAQQLDKAMKLFKQLRNSPMDDMSLKPDSFTYSILISAHSKQSKVQLAEQLFISALKDCGQQCTIVVYQPLLDAYGHVGDIVQCLSLFNVLLCSQSDYDLNNVCKGLNTKHKLFKNITKHNQNHVFPKLNAMCFNAVFKALSRMKQLRFGRNEMRNDDEGNVLLYLMDPEHSWNVIQYLLDIMNAMGIKKTSVTYGILFHLCNYNACFGDEHNEKNDVLQRAMAIYETMRKDRNVVIRTDMEMCNLLRTVLSIHQDDKEEKLQFVRWWLAQMNVMKLHKSDYAFKAMVQSGIHMSEINIL
eukprot:1144056_1